MHDPVDGADPMGVIDDWCITPGKFLNFDIPTYHLSAGLDPAVGELKIHNHFSSTCYSYIFEIIRTVNKS